MLKIFIPLSQYLGPTSANSCLKRTGIKPYMEYTCSPVLIRELPPADDAVDGAIKVCQPGSSVGNKGFEDLREGK